MFYQVLEAELAPIMASSPDPGAVRDRVDAMLLRLGHRPAPPATHAVAGDAAPLCVVPDRG